MTSQNGVNAEWESLEPDDFPAGDSLQDPNYLTGDPTQEFDPTAWAAGNPDEMLSDGVLGNDQTSYGLSWYNDIEGYDDLTLGELLQTGWDWGYDSYYCFSMTEETLEWVRPRINNKINQRFYYRDLGISPVGRWKTIFQSRLIEVLDRLGPLYDIIHDELDIIDGGAIREKTIGVDSDFPQARINPTQQDYASSSVETDRQTQTRMPQLDRILTYQAQYQELDQQVLSQLECCFSAFYRTTSL